MRKRTSSIFAYVGVAGCLVLPAVAEAQLSDLTQTPNTANGPGVPGEGIRKSFEQEVGAGRGDVNTPDSSIFIIRRDPFRSIRRGRQIFQRKFRVAQGFGPRTGDGIGVPGTDPDIFADASFVAGLADSCAACHGRPRGSAGHGGDVFTRPDSRDAPHLFGLGLQEMLGDEMTTELRATRSDAIQLARALGTPQTLPLQAKGVSFGSITANPDGTVNTAGVVGVDPNLRVKPFFAQGGTISIREFLVGAFNAEMGLEAPDPDLLAASNHMRVVTPSGMLLDGALDGETFEAPPVTSPTQDGDGDGHVNEIPVSIVDHEEFYLLHYFKPAIGRQSTESTLGRIVFNQIGCTSCHVPNLTIDRDRRVADLETNYDAVQGNPFNHMFATAVPKFAAVDDLTGFPTIKNPVFGSFLVRNFFADLKRHDLGINFAERQFNGTLARLFMTEPLWGVQTTAPYGHDGRSQNLEEVILRHGGEALAARNAFAALPAVAQGWVLSQLGTLQLFPPDDTASTLQPINPANPDYPQRGHGAIALTVLFNNTADVE